MKNGKFTHKLLLLTPALLTCLIDLALTSINQPADYWAGNLQATNEMNPIANLFMKNYTAGIFIFIFLWLLVAGLISYFLRPKAFRILALFVLIAHTWGASTWIGSVYGFWYVVLLVLINSILFIVMEDVYTSKVKALEESY